MKGLKLIKKRSNQKMTFKAVRLHLGCGKRILDGWIHIDRADFEHIQINGSIGDLSMFEDNSVDQIYSAHSLEYFDTEESLNVLREWNRVMKPGAQLNVAVPDFKKLVTIYETTATLKNIMGPLFGRMLIEKNLIYHKCVYDRQSLTALLQSSGFRDIKEYDPVAFLVNLDPKFDDHSLAFFPHMDRNGIQLSLCIEGRK